MGCILCKSYYYCSFSDQSAINKKNFKMTCDRYYIDILSSNESGAIVSAIPDAIGVLKQYCSNIDTIRYPLGNGIV